MKERKGYIGRSMSINAKKARDRGLLPASYRDNKVFEVVDDFEFIKVLVTDEDFEDAFMSSTGTPFPTKYEALEMRVKLKY